MADRSVRVWTPLSASTVAVQMSEHQLAALVSFLRTGRDEQYPEWPEHFADELEGKRRIDGRA